jgi:hypothetical protein
MAEHTESVKCANCGSMLDVAPNESVRTPCPSCGSTSRAYSKTATVAVGLVASASGTHEGARKATMGAVIRACIMQTVFAFVGLVIGILVGGIAGGLIGFVLSAILGYVFSVYFDRKVRVIISHFGR